MQARGALRIEAVEAFINGGMSARSSSDDRGSSLGKVAVHRKSRLAHCLPRNDGELRNSVEKRDLRCFKMSRRLKIFNFADQLIAGLRSKDFRVGSAKAERPDTIKVPIVFRRLSNRRNNAEGR